MKFVNWNNERTASHPAVCSTVLLPTTILVVRDHLLLFTGYSFPVEGRMKITVFLTKSYFVVNACT